jgi:hypothetical protein
VADARHDAKARDWEQQIRGALQGFYPTAKTWLLGGDFNIKRCTTTETPEKVDCAPNVWWSDMQAPSISITAARSGFKDDIFSLHGTTQGDMDVQYHDGCLVKNPDNTCSTQRFRDKPRIDFIFHEDRSTGLVATPPVASSFDLTCGILEGNTEKNPPPNCKTENESNPENYSDHRLEWTILS